MDIKNLITFIQVAELNSFTRAAEALGYSQSTISFQIRQLESELDSQLFERINRTVALTETGHDVLRYAHQIVKLTQEMEGDIHNTGEVRGHVRLAMADSLCAPFLDRGFAAFRKSYPQIALKVTAAGTEEMFRLLDHNEADAILTLDRPIHNTEYEIVREEKVGVHFVAAAGHPLSGAGAVSIRELTGQPFILTEKGMSYRKLLDEELAMMSLSILPVLEIGSVGLICSLVEQGIGISFLPDYVTEKKVRAGSLVRLETGDIEIDVWKQLLYHRDKWLSPQLMSVLQYCNDREFCDRSFD